MHFHLANPTEIRSRVRIRPHETKLGENIVIQEQLEAAGPRFVLFGVKEDLGARANLGWGGAHTAWEGFLDAFLHVQDTVFLHGAEIQLLGHFDFQDLGASNELTALREQVKVIDQEVAALVAKIVALGKIPLIIGGSHAGAYANLKGSAEGLRQRQNKLPLHCINLDAHSDYRLLEGRHSGNGFRYAQEAGYLQRYAILGLHENYTPQRILEDLQKLPQVQFSTWEDIFLREKMSFAEALDQAITFVNHEDAAVGVELDLDCIENVLASAITPSGLSTQQARYYVYQCARRCNAVYLHLCEGASQLGNGLESRSTGKLLSYLLSDFVKGVKEVTPRSDF
jgi:formiminoglutamase